MKEIKIKDNLIVCAETEKEKFGLIGLYPPITLDPGPQDDFIFNNVEADYHYNSGQITLDVKLGSLQEYLEILTYFIKKDWVNKITISDHWTWGVLYSWSKYNGKDKSSQVNVIKLRCSNIDKIFELEYNISIRLDRKELGRLRKDLLSIPEYKVIWVDIGVTNGFKYYKRYIK